MLSSRQKIYNLSKNEVVNIDGLEYSVQDFLEIDADGIMQEIEMHTSVVAFIGIKVAKAEAEYNSSYANRKRVEAKVFLEIRDSYLEDKQKPTEKILTLRS